MTPHGFRTSIAAILDERRNISLDAIKYLLGHRNQENIHYYLRRDQRKINQLRQELTKIEEELDSSLHNDIMVKNNNVMNSLEEGSSIAKEVMFSSITEDVLIKLLESYPKLA
ncbi:hypothetical protein AN963_08915 [Brevibacillus choshinensis]|uniref:Tyr recombinase domain-containing protein n=1 Tax=Brevibacillus choshinensis TaxID=54911 RepID=A0ABR5NE46_BRECH|nr:hypothetical protein AN963_08915 [Brevibacillus choshinensis]